MIVRLPAILMTIAMALALAGGAWAQSGTASETAYGAAVTNARSHMMRDPAVALDSAIQAEVLAADEAGAPGANQAIATARWLQSEALTRLGRPDEARPVAEAALALLGDRPAHSKLYADILLSLGRTMKLMGEHGQALETFQSAFDVYVAIGETRSQAIVLQSIGSIYNDARQYARAIEYYGDATERHQDSNLDLAAYNNLGNAYTALENYPLALENYVQALAIAADMNSAILQVRILNNIASLHVAEGNWDAADAAIDRAVVVAGDPDGTEWGRFLYGVRAQAALGRGELSVARDFIDRTFDGIELNTTNHHFTDFHETAARIYGDSGHSALALTHFRAFKRLDDESRDFAASANSALIGAQFDFAAQELEIEQLRIAGLQRDLTLVQSEAKRRSQLAIGSGILMLVLLIGAGFVIFAFRARNRMMRDLLNTDTETGLPSRHALIRDRNRALAAGKPCVYFAAVKLSRATRFETLLGFEAFSKMQQLLGERLLDIEGVTAVGLIGPGLFGAILDTDDETMLQHDMEELVENFSRPLTLDGVSLDISTSVGLANDAQSGLAVRNAIIALDQAAQKQAPFAIFNARELGDPTQNLGLMTRMKSALMSGDMQLHYQPKLDLRAGRVSSVEALCRWTDPERGYISPDDFIPQAEETGKIRELTEWTIYEALKEKARMSQEGLSIDVAVNISGRLLSDRTFGQRVLDILGYGNGGLTLEITETAMMHQPETALHMLERWVDAGCKIAIDDYGTGLSSLSYLKRLPCNELKLDKTFVRDAQRSAKDRTLIKSTVDLAHNLNMTLTAEGVEDELTLAALKAMGCDHAQGYVISKAVSASELRTFLSRNQGHSVQDEAAPVAGQTFQFRKDLSGK